MISVYASYDMIAITKSTHRATVNIYFIYLLGELKLECQMDFDPRATSRASLCQEQAYDEAANMNRTMNMTTRRSGVAARF